MTDESIHLGLIPIVIHGEYCDGIPVVSERDCALVAEEIARQLLSGPEGPSK